MDEQNLRRVFDHVKPSPQQEDAILERILGEGEQTGKRRYPLPRLAAVTVATAVLLTTGVFAAVWAGLDGRLLDYFGATPDNEALLSPAAVVVDQKMEDQGSTLHLRQLIADRYSAVALLDFTAPEGTVLDGDFYKIKTTVLVTAADGTELPPWTAMVGPASPWRLLEDDDGADNKISLLMRIDYPFPERDGYCMGADLTLEFDGLYSDTVCKNCLAPGHWEFQVTLPETDPGRYVKLEAPIEIEEHKATLTSVYLSPISLVWELGEGEDNFEALKTAQFKNREDNEWGELVSIHMADGEAIPPGEAIVSATSWQDGLLDYRFRLEAVIDPAQVTAVRLFDQVFPLEAGEK